MHDSEGSPPNTTSTLGTNRQLSQLVKVPIRAGTMLSLAGLSMAEQYQWGPAQFAILQSAYLAGYPLTQMLGGALADLLGARVVFAVAVTLWCVAVRSTRSPFHAFPVPAQPNLRLVTHDRDALWDGLLRHSSELNLI